MTPQELKNSILQLAIQGKLVEQRSEEGTAEELYRQIQEEKQRLVKAGKIKKEKNLPEITEDEKPFEIPESWKWVRVADCLSNRAGLSYKKDNLSIKSSKMIRILRGGNILEMKYVLKSDDVLIAHEYVNADLLLKKNMILTPAVSSLEHIGKMGRIDKDFNDTTAGGFVLILSPHYFHDTFSKYLLFSLSSRYFRDCCRNIVNKSGQAFYNLSRDKMMQLLLPLPPLTEQERIVAKIEGLLPCIDRYEQAWSRLENFNKLFPEDMKKSILQLAIQGKLVERCPEEGTAEELYQQIQAEKQQLIRAGKTKLEKPLPEITKNEVPFDIPTNWKWVRFFDLCAVLTCGYASTPTYVSKENGMPFISAKNVKPYRFMPDDHNYISYELYKKLTQSAKPEKGDILLTRVGAGIGEAAIIDTDLDFAIYVSLTLIKLINNTIIDNRYILYWLNSPIGVISAKKNIYGKNASQGNLNVKNVKNFLVPLPPLAEQKRIVAKLEELLPLCEMLKRG